jgi:hypothetical protein
MDVYERESERRLDPALVRGIRGIRGLNKLAFNGRSPAAALFSFPPSGPDFRIDQCRGQLATQR